MIIWPTYTIPMGLANTIRTLREMILDDLKFFNLNIKNAIPKMEKVYSWGPQNMNITKKKNNFRDQIKSQNHSSFRVLLIRPA